MNPQDPLASLNPLREPPLVGWWPLAPGWWILLGVLLLAVALLLYLLWRHHLRSAYRRQALRQLREIRQQYSDDPAGGAAAVNALLKAVALEAYPRREVAASSGASWLAFINSSLEPSRHLTTDYVEAVYRDGCSPPELEKICDSAASWIRRHRGAAR